MPEISNTSSTPIALPNGLRIQPGETAEVSAGDWAAAVKRKTIAWYVEQGVLKEGKAKADKETTAPAPSPAPAPTAARKP